MRGMVKEGSRTDGDLVGACLQGDGDAWEALVRRYRRLVYSVPSAFRFSPERADDVFQRVWLKLVERLDTLKRADAIGAWLVTTARRECIAMSRGESRLQDEEPQETDRRAADDPAIDETLERIEAEHAVALAFEDLGEPCRSLLDLLYFQDPRPSYEEISRQVGRPVGSLGPTRARCLRKLKKLYQKRGGTLLWSA